MKVTPLTLRFTPSPQRKPCAWLVSGDRVADWIAEIASWDVPHDSLRLRPIPRSIRNRSPLGVLVTSTVSFAPPSSPGCHPYGSMASRLFLPVEAMLFPAVHEREFRDLLPGEREYAFIPQLGLICFEEEDIVSLDRLLKVDLIAATDWSRATPGFGYARRLHSIRAEPPPSIELVIDAGRGDIGSEPGNFGGLPKAPGEPSNSLMMQALRGFSKKLLEMMDRLASKRNSSAGQNAGKSGGIVPAKGGTAGSGSRPFGITALTHWIETRLNALTDAMQRARNREVFRLMNLFKNNPDEALKYAIPMSHTPSRQGQRGTNLVHRPPDFRIGGWHGPTDYWDIPDDYQSQLISHYRQAANRELRLGRHRRAAFIFAELLGDFTSAASALMAGRFWIEAASLYEHKLKDLRAAAHCLEQGGLLHDAADIYIRVAMDEKAGDIFRQLNDEARAISHYETALQHLQMQRQWMSAADLCLNKLKRVEQAMEQLEQGWSHREAACMARKLDLLASLGRHEETAHRVMKFHDESFLVHDVPKVADVIAQLAKTYPDRTVRELAEDQTRVWTSKGLTLAIPELAARFRTALLGSAPDDKLLGRDFEKYLGTTTQVQPKLKKGAVQRIEHKWQISLAESISWNTAGRIGDSFLFCGGDTKSIHLQRFGVTGESHSTSFPTQTGWNPELPIVLACDPLYASQAYLHVIRGKQLAKPLTLPAILGFTAEIALEGLPIGSGELLGACMGLGGSIWQVTATNQMVVIVHRDSRGQITSTQTATDQFPDWQHSISAFPLPMTAMGAELVIALKDEIKVISATGPRAFPMYYEPLAITGSRFTGERHVVVSHPRGVTVCWLSGGRTLRLADDIERPMCGFIGGGRLVIAGERTIELYQHRRGERYERVCEFPRSDSVVKFLLSHPADTRFALCCTNDLIQVFDAILPM